TAPTSGSGWRSAASPDTASAATASATAAPHSPPRTQSGRNLLQLAALPRGRMLRRGGGGRFLGPPWEKANTDACCYLGTPLEALPAAAAAAVTQPGETETVLSPLLTRTVEAAAAAAAAAAASSNGSSATTAGGRKSATAGKRG
ncbi:unnamed protein product, partial [Ectocarpus sp. 8 AP-2014]